MASTKVVRIIRTWNVEVPVVYGDTEDSIKARVSEEFLDDNAPQAETRVIVHRDSDTEPPKPAELPELKIVEGV